MGKKGKSKNKNRQTDGQKRGGEGKGRKKKGRKRKFKAEHVDFRFDSKSSLEGRSQEKEPEAAVILTVKSRQQ